jgi:GTPase SAR1 family protein
MGASCSCSAAVSEGGLGGGEGQKEVTLCFIGLDNAGKSTVVNNYRGAPSKAVSATWGFELVTLQDHCNTIVTPL